MKKLLLLALAFCFVWSGCIRIENTSYFYENSGSYSVGGASIPGNIKNIEVDWISGSVEIIPNEGGDIEFFESEKKLRDEQKLHYLVDGDTLIIKFCRSGRWNFRNAKKDLTMKLPKGFNFDNIRLNGVSSNVSASALNAKELIIDNVSGSIVLGDSNITDRLELSSVSGDIIAKNICGGAELMCNTVSGKMDISTDALKFSAESISGSISLDFSSIPEEGKADSVSGKISVALPAETGFRLAAESLSGKVSSDFKMQIEGDEYICGDAESSFEFSTISGNIEIIAK